MKTVLVHDDPEAPPAPLPAEPQIRKFVRFLPGGLRSVLGALIAVSAGGVLAALGPDGRLESGRHLVSTPAAAIVSSVTKISNTSGVSTIFGQPTVRISVTPVQGTARAFVGIGRAADVDRYLARVRTKEITSLSGDPYSISGVRRGGQANAPASATQRFWATKASSAGTAEINRKIRDGGYRVVIMSATGHGGFATTSSVVVALPHIARYALAALLLGLLMASGGTALLIRTTARRERSDRLT